MQIFSCTKVYRQLLDNCANSSVFHPDKIKQKQQKNKNPNQTLLLHSRLLWANFPLFTSSRLCYEFYKKQTLGNDSSQTGRQAKRGKAFASCNFSDL